MITIVCSIYDVKSKAFSRPFFEVRRELAMRSIQAVLADGQSALAKFPEDFSLYVLGEFDDERGQFELLPQPELICQVLQLVQVVQPKREGV